MTLRLCFLFYPHDLGRHRLPANPDADVVIKSARDWQAGERRARAAADDVLDAIAFTFRITMNMPGENILDAALLRPLAAFDLSTASMLYVLVRMPLQLKETLPQSQIELSVDEWFKEKTSLKSAFVSEPVYVDDGSDRIDIVLFVGGFALANMVTSADKKVKEIKVYAAKNGYIKEREWQELIKSLTD